MSRTYTLPKRDAIRNERQASFYLINYQRERIRAERYRRELRQAHNDSLSFTSAQVQS